MAGNLGDRVALQDGRAQTRQRFILIFLKEASVDPFDFYADGVVVAVAPLAVTGGTRVPGAVIGADELLQITIATDIKVGRYLHAFNAFKVRVLVPVELVGKEALYLVTAVLARGKADAMEHDEINFRPTGARAKIG